MASLGFSLVHSCYGACTGFSLPSFLSLWNMGCRACRLQEQGLSSFSSQALECRFNSCSTWHVGSSWIRDWTYVSCIGRLNLYHWAAKGTLAFFKIKNRCGNLSIVFNISIEMIVRFLFFILLMWWVSLTNLWVLNHPCSPGMSATCLYDCDSRIWWLWTPWRVG